jgi:AcrR family transcriptional regulator
MEEPAASVAARPGRPRDPDIEDRVFGAAMDVYSRTGWSGFNFEAVTRVSGVGKAAIYRRWPDRGALLADTLKARWGTVEEVDNGSLRADLMRLAEMFLTRLTGEHGPATTQVQADRLHYEEVRTATDDYIQMTIYNGRQIVHRAVERGELPRGTRPALIIDLVVGGVQNHVMSTPPSLRPQMEAQMHEYGSDLVDTVIRGIGASPPT